MSETLRVTQRRSRNGSDKRQLDTLRSLGLRRIGHTVEVADNPQIRGMVHKVRHLVEVESAGAESASSAGADSAKSARADSGSKS